MKVTTEATSADLRVKALEAALADAIKLKGVAQQDAQDIFHELTVVKGKLARPVDQTGDNKPWLLFGAGCGVGAIVASIVWVVV